MGQTIGVSEKLHEICRAGGIWLEEEGSRGVGGGGDGEPEGLLEGLVCAACLPWMGLGEGQPSRVLPPAFLHLRFCVLKLLKRLESLCFEMQDDFYRKNDRIPPDLLFWGEEAVFYHCGIVSPPRLKPSEYLPG